MKKKVRKIALNVDQARRKVRGLTSRKTYHSVDTEFGVLTLDENAAKEPAPPRVSRNGKPRRSDKR